MMLGYELYQKSVLDLVGTQEHVYLDHSTA